MKKIDLPLLLDVLFYAACAWLISVGVLRYFRVSAAVAFTAASLLALAAGGASFLAIYTKHSRRALSKSERERREKLMLHLTLERPEGVLNDLEAALAADGKTVVRAERSLRADGEELVPAFTMQPVSADEVARCIRAYGNQPFTLLCNALTPEAERLLASFGRKAVRGDEIYALFARTDQMPDPLICGDIPRPKLRAKLRRAFSKRNARPFFVSGALLLVMSLFVLFPLYYVVLGGILLLCAVAVRLFGCAD